MRGALIVGLAASIAATIPAAPSPLPTPSGHFGVGRTRFDWADTTRGDAESPSRHRELVVWVWYPAAQLDDRPASTWMPGKWGTLYWADFIRGHAAVIGDTANHPLASIVTHAQDDVPVARSTRPYPVLVFAPGSGAIPLEYAGILEDVASHGYIVAAIASPRIAGFTVFGDGRVVMGRDLTGRSSPPNERPRSADEVIRNFQDAVDRVSKDMAFTLDRLAVLNADRTSIFNGHVDVAHAGAIGHSLGGAAALQLGYDDSRIGAIFDIDGSPIWKASNGFLGKPVLILSSANVNVGYPALSGAKPGIHLRLAGTGHTFSTDLLSMPFLKSPSSSPIAPNRALGVTAAYVDAFFGEFLEHEPSELLRRPAGQFPEISFVP